MKKIEFPSPTESIILELLKRGNNPHYGFELINKSGGKLKRGTAYVTLQRMEEKGLVSSRLESERVGPPRRMYSLTDYGENTLKSSETYKDHVITHTTLSPEPLEHPIAISAPEKPSAASTETIKITLSDEERDEELTELAEKVWPGSWVEFEKWFDAPGHIHVLRTNELGNIILFEISEHPKMREAMKAALIALAE